MTSSGPSILLNHYQELFKAFQQAFVSVRKGFRREDIHALRVTIKRLRAVISLLEIASEGSFEKGPYFALLKGLFSAAGHVRETQINLQLILQYGYLDLEYYTEDQIQWQKVAKKKLSEIQDTFDHQGHQLLYDDTYRAIGSVTDARMSIEATHFVGRKLEEIEWLRVAEHLDDKRLHKVRICLKMVNEILTILALLAPSNELLSLHPGVKEINQLIGDWHDHVVLKESICELAHPPVPRTQDRLNEFLKYLSEKICHDRRQILDLLSMRLSGGAFTG